MLEAANLIAVVGGDTTAHEVRQRARCHNCGVKGNNTYQIVYRGGSYNALIGAANTKMNGQVWNYLHVTALSAGMKVILLEIRHDGKATKEQT